METKLTITEKSRSLEDEITRAIFRILDDFSCITSDRASEEGETGGFSEETIEQIEYDEVIPNLLRNLKRYFQGRD